MFRKVVGVVTLLASLCASAANPYLEKAQRIVEELRYAEAMKSLDAAWATPGNDRATVLQILTLQGVVAATLGQTDKAKGYFKTLLYLNPEASLSNEYGPKVTTPFYEMKGRLGSEKQLLLEAQPAEADEQKVSALSVKVTDPLHLGRQLRFHVRGVGETSWRDADVPLTNEVIAQPVEGGPEAVEWWAEVVGDRQASLAVLGSSEMPLRAEKKAPVVATKPDPQLPSEVTQPREGPPPNLKPVAYGLLGGAGVALVVGTVFGLQASSARSQIDTATRDDAGRVTGITQTEAMDLDARVRSSATIANVALVSAVVLAGAGAGVFFLSPKSDTAPQLAIGLSPAGVSVTGAFQ